MPSPQRLNIVPSLLIDRELVCEVVSLCYVGREMSDITRRHNGLSEGCKMECIFPRSPETTSDIVKTLDKVN